jgi:hypothetical protein
VYAATSKTGTYKLKTTTAATSYKLTGLTANAGYYLKVSAQNASGEGAKCNYLYAKAVNPPAKPIVYSGTGDMVIDNIKLTSEFYVAHITHTGSSNFIIKDYMGKLYSLLVNKIGNYDGKVLMETSGTHALNIQADGSWTIEILPQISSSAVSFSGKGDFVTPFFKMPENRTWSFTHDGSSNFYIWAYAYDDADLVVNVIGKYNGTQIVDIASGKNVFFEIHADGNWTLTKK